MEKTYFAVSVEKLLCISKGTAQSGRKIPME